MKLYTMMLAIFLATSMVAHASLENDLTALQDKLQKLNEQLLLMPKLTPPPVVTPSPTPSPVPVPPTPTPVVTPTPPPTPAPTPVVTPAPSPVPEVTIPRITLDDIANKSIQEIVQIIEGLKVRIFASDKPYWQVGLPEFDIWYSLLSAGDQYFKDPKGLSNVYKSNVSTYIRHLAQLKQISQNLNSDVMDIKANIESEKKLSPQIKEQLLGKIAVSLNSSNEIMLSALANIIKNDEEGKSIELWKKRIPTSSEGKKKLEEDVGTFLKNYFSAVSREDKANAIPEYGTDKYAVENILDKLAQVIYLKGQKSFWQKIIGKKSDLLEQSKDAFFTISQQYPDQLCLYDRAKIADSNDKPSEIILGIAGALNGALMHLQRDLNKIDMSPVSGSPGTGTVPPG